MCATPKCLDEVLPAELIDNGFGTSTNIMINLSYLQVMIMANFMPDDKASLVDNNYWRILFTVQVPFQLLVIFLHMYYFTEETVDFNVKQGNQEEAIQLIRKVYPSSSPEVHQQMYNVKRLDHLNKIAAMGNTKDSVWKALTDKNQRGSSFICLALSIFNNLSGQSVICIYSTAIFEMMTSRGAISRYQVK